jgi:hypothetical protein
VVERQYEAARQDGYGYRAVRVRPAGSEPVDSPADPPSAAYTSTLTLTSDHDEPADRDASTLALLLSLPRSCIGARA